MSDVYYIKSHSWQTIATKGSRHRTWAVFDIFWKHQPWAKIEHLIWAESETSYMSWSCYEDAANILATTATNTHAIGHRIWAMSETLYMSQSCYEDTLWLLIFSLQLLQILMHNIHDLPIYQFLDAIATKVFRARIVSRNFSVTFATNKNFHQNLCQFHQRLANISILLLQKNFVLELFT